jgi:hypothetical protein
MNCIEIIDIYLKENEYDGLFNTDSECSCAVNDLSPCGELNAENCEVGYIQANPLEYDYMIGACKPEPCPVCEKPRDIRPDRSLKNCHHCGDELPF